MNRNMRMLHKENNRLDKTLCEDYQRLMTDIVCYLRGADISELQQEKVRYDLTLMLLEAQQRNAPLDEVFPEDYKAFCDTVIKELPPLTAGKAAGAFADCLSPDCHSGRYQSVSFKGRPSCIAAARYTKHLSAFLINTAAGYPAGHKRRMHCAVDLPQQL